MDKALASLRRSILAKAKAYPQPNFRAYLQRRLDDKLSKENLAALNKEQKDVLVKELTGELEQLQRMTKIAGSIGSPDNYNTVLQNRDSTYVKK